MSSSTHHFAFFETSGVLSKLQSKSAPCQAEVLVLKEGFDAKECDLENCAPPFLTSILRNIVKCVNIFQKRSKQILNIIPESG